MGRAQRIASFPCGRWTKWVVLAFWIVVFVVAGPLSGKLNSAQKNDASSWLPKNAESTQVVDLAKKFTPSDVFPALVVYERSGGPVTAAQAVIYLLAKHAGLTVNGQSAFILTVLVFGAGTDYALLLTARYREELRRHADRHQAMAVALGRAGPAILASGSTVILSLLCLLVAELSSTKSLGPVMAIGVAVGLCAMLTLLPALLVIFGRWMFWPRRPTLGSAEPTERGLWARIGARLARRRRLVWVVTAVVLGALALGLTGLKAEGLQNK